MPHEATLELYQVHAVTEGTDAQAEVSVRLSENGRSVTSKGADPDTLVASAKAYLGALNKLMVKRQKGGRVTAARPLPSGRMKMSSPSAVVRLSAGLPSGAYPWRRTVGRDAPSRRAGAS